MDISNFKKNEQPSEHFESSTVVTENRDNESGEVKNASKPMLSGPALAAYTSALLAACGGGNGSQDNASGEPTEPSAIALGAYYQPTNDLEAARFLQQAQFTSTQAEIASLRSTSLVKWLQKQWNTPWDPTTSVVKRIKNQLFVQGAAYANSLSDPEEGYSVIIQQCYQIPPFEHAYWYRLISPNFKDQMRQRIALTLSEFFVVSFNVFDAIASPLMAGDYMDMLVQNAFGNFRELLEKITLSCSMGKFLNIAGSTKGDANGTHPDENYAREIMQLFTIGLYQLNINGTPKLDSNGKPIPTYTQADVTALAKVFTGYNNNLDVKNYQPYAKPPVLDGFLKPMKVNPTLHDNSEVTFLGITVASDSNPMVRLKAALEGLFRHPNVGPFFARQMIQRLVTSNPTPDYVARVASAFNDNGYGIRGDLRAVWAAILLDYEARSPMAASDTTSGKLREPMLCFLQWAKTCGLTSTYGHWKVHTIDIAGYGSYPKSVPELGQSPLRASSVFNFFRPDYTPLGTAIAKTNAPGGALDPANGLPRKLCAPEFKIVDENGILKYINFMAQCIYKGPISGGYQYALAVDPTIDYDGIDLHATYVQEKLLVTNATELVNYLNLVFAAGQISSITTSKMINALNKTSVTATSTDAEKLKRIADAILMVMTCAEYLIQK